MTKNIVVRRTDEQDQILYQHFKRQRGANIGFYRSSNEEHPEQEGASEPASLYTSHVTFPLQRKALKSHEDVSIHPSGFQATAAAKRVLSSQTARDDEYEN